MEHKEAVVITNEGKFTRLNVLMHASCNDCGICKSAQMEILAENPINATPGQKVQIALPQNNMLKISFILFGLPLIAVLIGVSIGHVLAQHFHFNQYFIILTSVIFFLTLSIINMKIQDKKYNGTNHAKILEIINE